MILVDTSVWVDQLRRNDAQLAALLESGNVVMHPFVVGEIACGNLTRRAATLELLQALPAAVVAEHHEVAGFIERHRLYGKGIGYVDVHLLMSTALTHGATLWTRDQRLRTATSDLGCGFTSASSH